MITYFEIEKVSEDNIVIVRVRHAVDICFLLQFYGFIKAFETININQDWEKKILGLG